MFVQAIMLVLTLLIPGYYLRKEVSPLNDSKLTTPQIFIESMILGIALLIIPMILIGTLFDNLLDKWIYAYFFVNTIVIIIYLIQLLYRIKNIEESWFSENFQETLRKLELLIESKHLFDMKKITLYLIWGVVTGITLSNFIMPERGWDALHFYFPNSLFYYYSNDIPAKINYLNFLPAFKPPLNTLLYTYNWYITASFDSQLFPILFILGIISVMILFGKEFGFSDKFSYLAIIHLLTIPAFYMVFREYMYYQELPVTFFYSSTLLFLLKASNHKVNGDGDKKVVRYYVLISSVSASLTVLSKISGYTIFFMIIILIPLFGTKWDLIYKIPTLIGITTFLLFKGIPEQYFYTMVIVGILGLFLVYWTSTGFREKSTPISKYLLFFVIPILLGLLWLYQISQYRGSTEFLYNLYIRLQEFRPNFEYNQFSFISEIFEENGQRASWFMSVAVIFFGSQFNGFLGFFRIVSIVGIIRDKKRAKSFHFLLTWLIAFYMLWLTYFSIISVRYLSIIWIPLSFITIDGIRRSYDIILQLFRKQKIVGEVIGSDSYDIVPKGFIVSVLLPLSTSVLMHWPFIPVHTATKPIAYALYAYHHDLLITALYIIGASVLFVIIVLFFNDPITVNKIKINDLKRYTVPKKKQIITGFFITFTTVGIVGPYVLDFGLLAYSRFDYETYRGNYIYDNRKAVTDLYEAIVALGIPQDVVTIGLNMPGYEYYLGRPFLDLQMLGNAEGLTNITQFFRSSDADYVIQQFINYKIKVIITMKPAHLFYEVYIERYVPQYPFLTFIHDYADKLYENSEFILYYIQ